jgi:hypothetical protein
VPPQASSVGPTLQQLFGQRSQIHTSPQSWAAQPVERAGKADRVPIPINPSDVVK